MMKEELFNLVVYVGSRLRMERFQFPLWDTEEGLVAWFFNTFFPDFY